MMPKLLFSLLFVVSLSTLIGCSGIGNPVIDDSALPESISNSDSARSGMGILGSYNVAIDPSTLDFEMTPLRQGAIGESDLVNGIEFFTWYPCAHCCYIEGIQGDANGINLAFYIRHPMQPGNTGNPPSGFNRLDLDVFDPEIVIVPGGDPQNFPLLNQGVKTNFCQNQTGFTSELNYALSLTQSVALPYFLIVDDSISGTSTYNKLAMGQEENLTISIKSSPSMIYFTLHLTMGYGVSATFWQRLTPKYYNPEFNRKAAWKVTATPQGFWPQDSFAPVNVRVEVYDWQHGATVCTNPADYANAPSTEIYSQSDVLDVTVEVLGMADWTFSSNTPVSGTGMPNDPLIYMVPVGNYNYLSNGTYPGIVKVTDTRSPETNLGNSRDVIFTTPDGRTLNKYLIPEYATYQTFTAIVG